MKRRRMIPSWRKISVLLFVFGCLLDAESEMKWIDRERGEMN